MWSDSRHGVSKNAQGVKFQRLLRLAAAPCMSLRLLWLAYKLLDFESLEDFPVWVFSSFSFSVLHTNTHLSV